MKLKEGSPFIKSKQQTCPQIILKNNIILYFDDDEYGANVNACRARSEKNLASYRLPARKIPTNVIHAESDFHSRTQKCRTPTA
jgi:hypothetical protein